MKNYVENESTIALLEGNLVNTTESTFNMQIQMTPAGLWLPGEQLNL